MTTGRDLVTKAMQKNGLLLKTEEPSADEIDDGLAALNALISSWSNDSLNIYARTWENFSLTSGQSDYMIGTGGDFDTTRPTFIAAAFVRTGTIDETVTVLTEQQYYNLTTKNPQGTPYWLVIDNAYPLAKIRLYPVPQQTSQLHLLTEKPLNAFTLDSDYQLPPGWERAVIYNLAREVAPEYSQQANPDVDRIANESLGLIRNQVARIRTMDAYPLSGGQQNIYSGYFR